MNETLSAMSVAAARQLLRDTSTLPPERAAEAQRAIDQFYAARPVARACLACRCMIWSEHTTDGNAVWACASCHRPASLTAAEWYAQQQAAEAVRKVQAKTAADAAPDPHEALEDALTARAAANAEVVKLDRAVPVARAALVEAQVRHDRAVENAEAVNAHSAEHLAVTFYNGGKPADAARTAAAARGELTAATDALVIARNAKTILDTKVKDARSALGVANDRARKAATRVIASERLEDLLDAAVDARANYLESVGSLGWLIREHAIPNGDGRPSQVVSDADTPPSAWREAPFAGRDRMEAMRAALMADPEATI